MRLALIITSDYHDNPRLETHRAASLDSALITERLLSAEPEFSVERLEADRDLPERLETLLEQYPGELESLVLYFSGYVALSQERGPALLLSGARIKAFPVSRLKALLERTTVDTVCIFDVAAMIEGTRWPNEIARELATALAAADANLSALVAVRLLASRAPLGVSRFTDLFALVLEWLGRHGRGPIDAHDVYGAMKREKASFAQIAASAYVGAKESVLLTVATPPILGEHATDEPSLSVDSEGPTEGPESLTQLAYLPSAPPDQLEARRWHVDNAPSAASSSASSALPAGSAATPSSPEPSAAPVPAVVPPSEGPALPRDGLGAAPSSAGVPGDDVPLPQFPMGPEEGEHGSMPGGDATEAPVPARHRLETLPGLEPGARGDTSSDSSSAVRAPISLVPPPTSFAAAARRASLEPHRLHKRRRAILAPPSFRPGAPLGPSNVPAEPEQQPAAAQLEAPHSPRPRHTSEEESDESPTPWPPTSQPVLPMAGETDQASPISSRSIEQYQRALDSLPDDDPGRTALLMRLGHALRADGQYEGAVAQYRQVLAQDPSAQPAFDALTELLTEQGAFDEVITLCRERLSGVYDEDETVSLFDQLVSIWLDKLDDTTEALRTLEERLAFRTDRAGLECLVRIHELRRDVDAAVAAREELAASLTDPAEQVDALIDAAHQAEVELGDSSRAERLARKAFDLDRTNPVALEFTVSVLKSQNDFAGIAELYEQALALELVPEVALGLLSDLIAVYREQLRDPERTARTARRAIRLAPDRADLRIVLADAYDRQGLLGEALDQARAAAMIAPDIPVTYRIARRILQRSGDVDAAYAAAGLASWLDPSDIESARFTNAFDSTSLLVAERTLADEDWQLLADEVNPSLLVALDAIHDAVVTLRVNSRNRKPLELDPTMRHSPEKSTATVARSVQWAGRLLRIGLPAVYILPDLDEPLVVARTDEPSLLFGRALATGHTLTELAFLSGRHLTLFRREYYLLALFRNARKLALPLRGALMLASGRSPAREDVRNVAKKLQRLLKDSDLEQLCEATDLLDADIDALLEEWMGAVQRTATRAGLLACGHPQIAGTLLDRYPLRGALDPEQQREALVLFALSDQYSELRRRLGVQLAEAEQHAE
jgi:tetratricopeptide (TPR) repeat protein